MPFSYENGLALAKGVIGVEEAETLLQWRKANPAGMIDLSQCSHLHTAALQVVMATKIKVAAVPEDEKLAALMEPVWNGRGRLWIEE